MIWPRDAHYQLGEIELFGDTTGHFELILLFPIAVTWASHGSYLKKYYLIQPSHRRKGSLVIHHPSSQASHISPWSIPCRGQSVGGSSSRLRHRKEVTTWDSTVQELSKVLLYFIIFRGIYRTVIACSFPLGVRVLPPSFTLKHFRPTTSVLVNFSMSDNSILVKLYRRTGDLVSYFVIV